MISNYSKLKANSLVTLTGVDADSVNAEITRYDIAGNQTTTTEIQSLSEIDDQLSQLQPIIQELRELRDDVAASISSIMPEVEMSEPISLF